MAGRACDRHFLWGKPSRHPATDLVAHEIARQSFGAVTEKDWDDVWLSEGFATYFTLLYTEHYEGRDALRSGLSKQPGYRLRAAIEIAERRRHPRQPVGYEEGD